MRIDVVRALPEELMESAWAFYREAFDELRTLAVQRHVYHRHEFEAQMADERVLKYVGIDGDQVRALATLTNDLAAVPLISPDYFESRWPDLYQARRIYYIGFTAVQAGSRGLGVLVQLMRRIGEQVLTAESIMVLDVCAHNEAEHSLPNVVKVASGRVHGTVRSRRLDSQSYWVYEFPAAS
jgi:hypothetical protein